MDTGALAQILAAAGTVFLGGATVYLGWQARDEARAVRDEARQVAEQVDLERQQLQAASRAVVIPTSPDGWSDGSGTYEGDAWARVLPVKNAGPGAALNVRGQVTLAPPRGVRYETVPSNLGPGDQQDLRFNLASDPRADLAEWKNATGHLWYQDIAGATWETEFGVYIEGQHYHRYIDVRSIKVIKQADGTVVG